MPTTARERGFTLIEVLASITAFTIVFLAGFGGIGKLLLTQDQNYARTLAASAAMLIADWHHHAQVAATDFTKSLVDTGTGVVSSSSTDTTHLLAQIPAGNLGSIKWHGYDFTWTGDNKPDTSKDQFYVFNATPSLSTPAISLDLNNDHTKNPFTDYEYEMLLVCVSPASSKEGDSHVTFRQLSFWYGPPNILKDLRTASQTITLELVGRFLIADTYAP